jgi:glycosyltransferase involved in cell wall biosynthesis
VRGLLRLHREERVDVWHAHVFGREHRDLTRAARRARWPMVVSLHLILEDYLPHLGGKAGLKELLSGVSRVTLVSNASRRELAALLPAWKNRSAVVHYGAPPPRRAPRGRGLPRRFVLCVARLAPYKGLDLLLMAFARLLDAQPGTTLVLCGRDQLRGALEDFAATLGIGDRVRFVGERKPDEVAALLRACDFLVHPSRRENLPLALLEAMAAGKAIVASSAGGIPELLRPGRDALIVPPNDVGALAAGMRALAGNRALRKKLGRAALERSRAFTWERAARAYERLYVEALQSRRRPPGMRSKK